ncbi:Uncharacterized conserved protein YehS, DUF1456 family [Psychrobacillus sp. OK028]|uniref:DUF1456 family protein n=1 Tax=Psychrobacillus sp. OK028 TaxID=1884359 RepID=UPI000885D3C3|nr:DUF1456 family protein [Psychrobacillus sp. OK028]SDO08696.1 Uncharacterized conserved protein YehS, DUF1456 family [Psychrobacillus sp. OK028]
MENNDILIRLRYALDIKNKEMVEIFKLGGVEVTKEEVLKILTKSKEDDGDEEVVDDDTHMKCNNKMLESFLNGFITYKRGKQDPKPGLPASPEPTEQQKDHVNNMLLKKLKVALQLTTEDMLDILDDGGIAVSKGELGAILRKPGHRNYKECGDNFARKFLKGLAVKYRG